MKVEITRRGALPSGYSVTHIRTKALMNRDPDNPRVIHVRVLAFHSTGQIREERKCVDLECLDIQAAANGDSLPPAENDEAPVAYAHFILLRTDLATSVEELQEALSRSVSQLGSYADRVSRTTNFLTGGVDLDILEEAMEAADDRWIDQVAVLERFIEHPALHSSDLFEACIRELLCFTNPTSGMVIGAEYPSPQRSSSTPPNWLNDTLNEFAGTETAYRTNMRGCPYENRDDLIWIVSGIAQNAREIQQATEVRLRQD